MKSIINDGVFEKFDESDLDENGCFEIPKGVIWISEEAFKGSNKLLHVKIPESVKVIGKAAFSNCENLQEVYIPDTSKVLGQYAFFACSNLKHAHISENTTQMGAGVFCHCESLEDVNIPKGIQTIEGDTFSFCKNLKEIVIPPNIKYIDYDGFSSCESIKKIELPDNMERIGDFAFRGCTGLEEVKLPKKLKLIGYMSFFGCKSLKNIDIPETTNSIRGYAFSECSSLQKLDIPASVYEIENFIVADCPHVKEIKIHRSMFDKSSFYDLGLNPLGMIKFFDGAEIFAGMTSQAKSGDELKFIDKIDCKKFKKLLKELKIHSSKENELAFLNFAFDIGCLSKDQQLSQRACEWLKERIIRKELDINEFAEKFDDWYLTGENKEFSNFLFGKVAEKKGMTNFEEIIEQKDFESFLFRIYQEYLNPSAEDVGGRLRDEKGNLKFAMATETVNADGMVRLVKKEKFPTVELFKEYFDRYIFSGIQNEADSAIAHELIKHGGMKQAHFDLAKEIMEESKKKKIAPNILNKHLEGSVEGKIEEYKEKIDQAENECLQTSKEMILNLKEIVDKQFTYDWLEKNDPMNFCLGLYCNCCANLAGAGFGILKSNFVDQDIQNLVIMKKGKEGKRPCAKSTMYINRNEGYMVFNNIEVANHIKDEQKEEILKEYKAGVIAFIEEYNKEHPDKPIKKASVGLHLNDLESQIRDGAKPEEILELDERLQGINFAQYGTDNQNFSGDWDKGDQYLIWQEKPKKEMEHE